MKKIEKIIEAHALILLNMYGVPEKKIDESPNKLKVFVELLSDELVSKLKERDE